MNIEPDANSRGWALLLRAAGAVIPIAVPFALVLKYGGLQGGHIGPTLPAPLADFLKVAGFVWGWPGQAYTLMPLGFGLLGLLIALFVVVLLFRRDRFGAMGIVGWSLFFGWLLAYLTTTD
jgi:hypothetical protein